MATESGKPELAEPRFTAADCDRFAALVQGRLGMHLDPGQDEFFLLRLRERMLALGLSDPGDYYRYLTVAAGGAEESARLLDSILVNETHFFRTQPQIDAFRQVIIPELLRRKHARPGAEFRVWSAACSTGEEVYSLAIILRELLPPDMRRTVLGTDISQKALAAAANGVYGARSVANVTPTQLRQFFAAVPDGYRVNDLLRADACFKEHNLIQADYPGGFDVIFCRNVLIYFELQERNAILCRLYESLNPDGFLVVGYSENLRALPEYFQSQAVPGGVIYRKWGIDRRKQRCDWHKTERRRRAVTRFTVNACRQTDASTCEVPVTGLIAPGPDSRELTELREQLLAAVPFANLAGKRVIINLAEVRYLNNHTLGALKVVREAGKKMGVAVYIAVPDYVAEMVLGSELYDMLALLPSPQPGNNPATIAAPPVALTLARDGAQLYAAMVPLREKQAPAAAAGRNRASIPPPCPPVTTPVPEPARANAGDEPAAAAWDAPGRRLTLRGEWPQSAAGDFKRQLLPLLDGEVATTLTVDFARVAFMDVALLQELARFCRLYRGDGGSLVVAGANELVRRRLCQLLDLTPSEQLAFFVPDGPPRPQAN